MEGYIKKIKPANVDVRGKIFDIFDGKEIEHIGYIISKKGAIRGNHYHKKSKQYTYILKGRLKWFTKDMRKKNSPIKSQILRPGDFIIDTPWVAHTMIALEDSEYIFFTDHSRRKGRYEKDTFICLLFTNS